MDAGLLALFVGLLALVKPVPRLSIGSRARAASVLGAGAALVLAGFAWPVAPLRLSGPPMRLDTIVPVYQFGEVHDIRIQAPVDRVYQAIRDVRADEIRLFRLLTWLRSPHLPGRGPENILNAPESRPLLDVALQSGFVLVAEEPPREIVFGTVVCCDGARARSREELLALSGPGVAKAVMNFHVADEGGSFTRLTTETRVFATGERAGRRFAVYWRIIYPGSALIRRMWLRAIRNRAERP